jgi:hypothetical protein
MATQKRQDVRSFCMDSETKKIVDDIEYELALRRQKNKMSRIICKAIKRYYAEEEDIIAEDIRKKFYAAVEEMRGLLLRQNKTVDWRIIPLEKLPIQELREIRSQARQEYEPEKIAQIMTQKEK